MLYGPLMVGTVVYAACYRRIVDLGGVVRIRGLDNRRGAGIRPVETEHTLFT